MLKTCNDEKNNYSTALLVQIFFKMYMILLVKKRVICLEAKKLDYKVE
jgi:hypothetical protein